MRSSSQLLRTAIGDPRLKSAVLIANVPATHFDVYRVRLPSEDFRGFPPDWIFAILQRTEGAPDPDAHAEILQEARRLFGSHFSNRPVVLVSANRHVNLGAEFNYTSSHVFCLDAQDLPRQEQGFSPRNAPFVLALRHRLNNEEIRDFLSPYQKQHPVSGWRFFGRKKELRQLTSSKGNVVVVGGRRVGKTSLLKEAYRSLQEAGQTAYYVDVQNCRTVESVQGEILREIDPKEYAKAIRRGVALGEAPMAGMLRRMAKGAETTTLLFDEMGNVLSRLSKEDWSFLGQFRKYSHNGQLRIVFSCFQEMFLQQQKDFGGPLVNFADTLRLGVFTESEAEEFVTAPLEFWKPLSDRDRRSLMNLVDSVVGRHPFCLQYFCYGLFERVTADADEDVMAAANRLLRREQDFAECFSTPVDDLFFKMDSPTLMYLFLHRCHEADAGGHEVNGAALDDDWVEEALERIGYGSTFGGRRNILDGLEIHGLCVPESAARSRQLVAAPVIYPFIKNEGSLDKLLAKLKDDIRTDYQRYGLAPRSRAAASREGTRHE
jgi:hypothetical protein